MRQIPNPVAQVLGNSSGTIYKNRLLVAPGIAATLLNFDFDVRFMITKFSVSIVINDSSVFVKNNNLGFSFNDEIKQAFSKTKSGNKLIIYGIQCVGPDKIIRELSPIEFTISD